MDNEETSDEQISRLQAAQLKEYEDFVKEFHYILTIEDLDNTLFFLYHNQTQGWQYVDIWKSLGRKFNIKFIENITLKLLEDGYIYKEMLQNPKGLEYPIFNISFNGIHFFESASIKGRPFKSIISKNTWKRRYAISKTIAIIINAVAILSIGIKSCVIGDKTTKLEQENKTLKDSITMLNKREKINSLLFKKK
jgi:hypothetical protein